MKYTRIDLTNALAHIELEELPCGVSRFEVETKKSTYLVEVNKNALCSSVSVWLKIATENGGLHSRYESMTQRHDALIGNSAKLWGYSIDDFGAFADALKIVNSCAGNLGVRVERF